MNFISQRLNNTYIVDDLLTKAKYSYDTELNELLQSAANNGYNVVPSPITLINAINMDNNSVAGVIAASIGDMHTIKYLEPFDNTKEIVEVAISNGHLNIVKHLMKHLMKDDLEPDGLRLAIDSGNSEMIDYFTDDPKSLHQATMYAIEAGHSSLVKKLIANGANFTDHSVYLTRGDNYRTGYKITGKYSAYLLQAVFNQKYELIDYFIKLGAKDYDSALTIAADYGDLRLVNKFIDLGAKDFNWALNNAIEGRRVNPDAILTLINAGATNANDVIDIAIEQNLDGSMLKIIRYLLSSGQINIEDALEFNADDEADEEITQLLESFK